MHLGDHELVRVFAKHAPYSDGHLGKVVNEMRWLGAPIVRVVEWGGEFFALEGSHRLAAAHWLGLVPQLIVETPERAAEDDERFWDRLKAVLPAYTWVKP
jgi:hypothetical protein